MRSRIAIAAGLAATAAAGVLLLTQDDGLDPARSTATAASGGSAIPASTPRLAAAAATTGSPTAPAAASGRKIAWGMTRAPARHRIRPRLPARPAAGILIDLSTGEVMWSYRADARRPIASLTKMMNALVVTSKPRLDNRVRISSGAAGMGGSVVGGLAVGSMLKVSDLLKGMLIVSGNDAAVALAQGVGHGGSWRFVRQMNLLARKMRLKCTHFSTPEGLSISDRSCARDLAFIAKALISVPALRRIVATGRTRIPIGAGRMRALGNRNPLMKSHYRGINGIKTGHTRPAGFCLVATARRGKRQLLSVMLAEDEAGRATAALLDQGFAALRR